MKGGKLLPIKVCQITTVHHWNDTRIFWRECRSLRKAGYAVTLIAPHHANERIEGIDIVAIPKTKNRLKRCLLIGAKVFLLALKQRAEIYHFHDPEFLPWALLLKFLSRKPVVYDAHEDYPEEIPCRSSLSRKFKFLLTPLLKFILEFIPSRLSDLLVFPTYSLQQKVKGGRSIVLLNLPTTESFKDRLAPIPWEQRQYDIVHFGNLIPSRAKFMLEIAKCLKKVGVNFKWLFVGIPPKIAYWILANEDEKFIEEHFHFITGWVPLDKAIRLVKNSRIGFNYFPFEQRFLVVLPVKVLDYMMTGLPVVSTALPELKRLLPAGCAILVDSEEPLPYALAIKHLLQNPSEAMKMGENGKKLILEKLNWEMSEEKKLLESYQALLHKKTNGRMGGALENE